MSRPPESGSASESGVVPEPVFPPMPRSVDDVTPDWLTAALRSRGRDVVVGRIRRRTLGEGAGMLSAVELLELDYERGDGPSSMVLKMPTSNDANRTIALTYDVYRREVVFYRDVAALTPAATPEVYFAELEDRETAVLLIEDMSQYRLGDQIEGCGPAAAELCMVEVGELHATFWNDVDRPELELIPFLFPSYSSDALVQGASAGWDPMIELFGDFVPDHLQGLKSRYLAAIPRMQEWMTTPPLTLVHGDFRVDNLCFGTRSGHVPVAAFDWQSCLRSKAVFDLGFFMSGSVPIEDRRAHERDLLARWHETLCHAGVRDYSLDVAWEDYRRSILYVWTLVVVIAGTLDSSNERARAWITQLLERSVAAIEDLGLVDLLAEFE